MTFTLLGMAEKLAKVAIETALAEQMAVEAAAHMVQAAAKDIIGHPNSYWPPLADATIARKATGDSPLLETGELRNSIEYTVGRHVAWVGSNNDKAVWQEFGTSRIPPRPFIYLASIESEDAIHALTVKTVGHAFAGHGVALEILHAVKEGMDWVNEKLDESNQRNNK